MALQSLKSSGDVNPYNRKRGQRVSNQSRSMAIDHRVAFALFSLFTAILSLLFVAVTILAPSITPAQQLSSFVNNRAIYYVTALVVLVWSAVAIPFVAGLGALLRDKGGG